MSEQTASRTQKSLDRITEVDPRSVWENEERDFTPWLARNIELLSKAVGIRIKVDGTEEQVGLYQLDIRGHDESNENDAVIIENQLDQTDHKHLGQLITYAAGSNAKFAVWIATQVRDEHRTAVEWLNRARAGGASFFLVRLRVISIGASSPAPEFFLEAAPSEFERTIEGFKAKSPAISPRTAVWGDAPDSTLPVYSWPELLRQTMERALDADAHRAWGVRILDEQQAENLRKPLHLERHGVVIEGHGGGADIRNKISRVLKNLGKPVGFLHVVCNTGDKFNLPNDDESQSTRRRVARVSTR